MPNPDQKILLRIVLATIALLALAGLAHRLMANTPAALEPNWKNLTVPGYRLVAQQTKDAQAGADLAYGTLVHYRVDPLQKSNDGTFTLSLMTVHSRETKTFHVEDMTTDLPSLHLRESNPHSISEGGANGTTVALGQIDGQAVLQTCLVQGGKAALDMKELAPAVEARRVRGWKQSLYQVLGLQPNVRWDCLLISISTNAGPNANAELLTHWGLVHSTLRDWPLTP